MVIRSQPNACRVPPGPATGPSRPRISSNALGQSSSVPSSSPIKCLVSVTRASGRQQNRGTRWGQLGAPGRRRGGHAGDLTPAPRATPRPPGACCEAVVPGVLPGRTAGEAPRALVRSLPKWCLVRATVTMADGGEAGGAGMELEIRRLHLASLRGVDGLEWPVHGFVVTHPGVAVMVDTGVGGPQEWLDDWRVVNRSV